MNRLTAINDRGQITIPAKLRKQLDLTAGQKVLNTRSFRTISIQPLKIKGSIMDLAGSVKTPTGMEHVSIEKAIERAKTLKAQETANQLYE